MLRKTLILILFTGAAACGKSSDSESSEPRARGGKPTAASPAQKEADQIFVNRCTPCHGPSGGGNGPASASLSPKPRDLRDPAWQGSVTDDHIEKVIQYGGAAVGKSAAMPANPDLNDKPQVIDALRAKVRGFGAR
jgi:mono/diheme cytochrome c family protein